MLKAVKGYHRHCTNVSFTAVLGMDVLQHCVSRQRSLVPNASVKVLDAICVSAGMANQRHPVIVLTNAVHKLRGYRLSSGTNVIGITILAVDDTLWVLYQCPPAPSPNEA